jgi:hypothetical protein
MSREFPPDQQGPMAELYDKALDSDVTLVALDWLARAHLLLRVAGDDVKAAQDVIHTDAGRVAARSEYDALTDDARNEMGKYVGGVWSACLKEAIGRLWHACAVLEIDPTSMGVDMVALHAATLLSKVEHAPEAGS